MKSPEVGKKSQRTLQVSYVFQSIRIRSNSWEHCAGSHWQTYERHFEFRLEKIKVRNELISMAKCLYFFLKAKSWISPKLSVEYTYSSFNLILFYHFGFISIEIERPWISASLKWNLKRSDQPVLFFGVKSCLKLTFIW